MKQDTCPYCDADLQDVGVCEHGLATFEAHLAWNHEAELYEMEPGEEPRYGECRCSPMRALAVALSLVSTPTTRTNEPYDAAPRRHPVYGLPAHTPGKITAGRRVVSEEQLVAR